jgi:predicted ABC-type transport system involved in lysophospholipase L1 biosynthesis ATPase subunit
MKTVYLSDTDFEEISSAMVDAMNGQSMLMDFLAGRYGPDSDQVKKAGERLVRLEEAERSLKGVSSWRGKKIAPSC